MADRISELPDAILSNILSFLPTKLVATTSILSKRWKSVWLFIFNFDFDDETFKDFHSFTNFVSSTMSALDTTMTVPPIHSLTFKCTTESSPYDLKHLNQFLDLAIQGGELENLNIHMPYKSIQIYSKFIRTITLAPSIFRCRTLQVLKLNNVILRDITNDHNKLDLPLLKTLHLRGVVFESDDYLVKFLSSCYVLQELQGYHLRVRDCSVQKNIEALPNLVKANMFDRNIPLTLLARIHNLHLQTYVLTCYNELPMFHCLTYINIIFKIHSGFPQTSKLMWLLKLLQHCPKLQNFTIQDCVDGDEYDMFDKYSKDQQSVPLCLSSQLKTFYLGDYKGTKSELQFATYIMQNSKVLHTMTIKTSHLEDIDAKNQMLVKLSSCTKGSTTCKLLLIDGT